MIYIKKPLIVSGFFNAAKPTHQKSNVRRSLSADLQRHVFVCCVPKADFKKLSRPEGGSQSQLISQSERPSQLLSRATQTGQLV